MATQMELRIKVDSQKPTKEQLKTWRRRLKLIKNPKELKHMSQHDHFVRRFYLSVKQRVDDNMFISRKQQYWLAHFAGEKEIFLREEETDIERKQREINEDLDYQARNEMIEEIPIGDSN